VIRLFNESDMKSLRPDSEAAVRILGRLTAYGLDCYFAPCWTLVREGTAVTFLSIMDGNAVLAGDVDEELLMFINMKLEIRAIRTNRKNGELIEQFEWDAEYGVVMTPGNAMDVPESPSCTLAPREIYPVVESCFGDLGFDAWYVDVSHRIRHGCCRIAGIKEGNAVVCCAMTVSECDGAALIGAVGTLPQARGRGYASSVVLHLARELDGEGKRVLLSPKNEGARRLYEKIGFVECGEWAELRR